MAGTPKKRVKIEQAQAEARALRQQRPKTPAPAPSVVQPGPHDEIPELEEIDPPPPPRRPPPPPRAAPAPDPRRAPPPRAPTNAHEWGPEFRGELDSARALSLRELATQLRPGLRLRIMRQRPTWCAGWIEDVAAPRKGIGELLQYIRDEHGGQLYTIIVLNPSGIPLYESEEIAIAEPVRRDGRPIDREDWDRGGRPRDRDERASGGTRVVATNQGPDNDTIKLILSEARESRNQVFDAVRAMTESTTKTTADLVRNVVQNREQQVDRGTLSSQLGEFVQVSRSIDKVRSELGGDKEPSDPTAALEAQKEMMKMQIMASALGLGRPRAPGPKRGAPPGQAAPRGAPQQPPRAPPPRAPQARAPQNGAPQSGSRPANGTTTHEDMEEVS